MFAALAVDASRFALVETVLARVWGEHAPPRARRTLHTHLSRIRRLIEEAGVPIRLAHRCGGYALELEPDRVDLHLFTGLTAGAGDPNRSGTERATPLREALGLWHGEPLAGVRGTCADLGAHPPTPR